MTIFDIITQSNNHVRNFRLSPPEFTATIADVRLKQIIRSFKFMKTSDFFIMPKIPRDTLMRADADCIRTLVLLCESPGLSFEQLMESLNFTSEKLSRALKFWTDEKVIDKSDAPVPDAVRRGGLSSHPAEVLANSRVYNAEYSAIVERAERMWGTLTRSDLDALYGALNELKLPIEVVLMLLRHLKDTGAANMKQFERAAMDWSKRGLFSAKDAQAYLDGLKDAENYAHHIAALLSLSYESLTVSEKKILASWHEQGYSDEMISDTHKRSLPYTKNKNPLAYMNKILIKDMGDHPKSTPAQSKPGAVNRQDDDFSEIWRINREYLQRLKDEPL